VKIIRPNRAKLLMVAFCVAISSGEILAQQQQESGQSTAAPNSLPQRTETIQYDNWTVTCRDIIGSPPKKKNCFASFAVLDEKRRQLMNWVIGRDTNGKPLFIVQVPQISTGILLKEGLQIKLGRASSHRLSFVMCASNQCQASTPLDNAMSKELLGASDAVIMITSGTRQEVKINVSNIKGTDRAIAAVRR